MQNYFFVLILFLFVVQNTHCHNGESVHDALTNIKERMLKELSVEEILNLNARKVRKFLSDKEAHVLGHKLVQFHVNVPVDVYILRDQRLKTVNVSHTKPYWLGERNFTLTPLDAKVDGRDFDVWVKSFPAGKIELGVNSVERKVDQYLIALKPQNAGDKIQVKDLYPGQCRVTTLQKSALAYVDDNDDFVEEIPQALNGLTLIQASKSWRKVGRLVNVFSKTHFPSTEKPDQIVLTWSDDPKTTQTIQWRTNTKVSKGVVAYWKKDTEKIIHTPAKTNTLTTKYIVNDPVCLRHTATLKNLQPDTTYMYKVGNGNESNWSGVAQFTTAPSKVKPFSFVYMGDAQNGLDFWGKLLKKAFEERPDADFYIMAGDLINRGDERWDWDHFFFNCKNIYDRKTLVPAIGNHEDYGNSGPWLYLQLFTLFENGPQTIEKERAYSFTYSNTLFIVLDTNVDPETQVAWLEEQLKTSNATWKIVVYHHPAYSSAIGRDNKKIRNLWTPLFDKYHVDMALQGHDHSYLRTYPMFAEKRVKTAKDGTYYVVSVSGVKMYRQSPELYYREVGFMDTSTYQVLDIEVDEHRLLYRARDINGKLLDEIEIRK
ncbi:purple acid phosphatase family protein [Candidatus Uabimicrobium amorphum]|uniref:Metallophosphoesterase n=1 Tax=Uabimicrobium amorphum TaxID=2596890 RepID=A0A5S9IJJ5_UABAM|nr:metallophosphoesterase family protein [Candidatus Uabimicrobium amorphum]BBM83023.1 metallophosphoesterase [Candidatus Uabimicrobium amorphum]